MSLQKTTTKTHGKNSYCHTVVNCNFEYVTFKERLDYMAEHYPNTVTYVFNMNNGLEITYSDLRDRSYLLARNFMSLGLKKGERIAFLLPNTYELAVGYFSAALAGLVSVPFDASYGVKQIEYMLKNTESSAVVIYNSLEYANIISELFPELKSCTLDNFKSTKFPHLRHVIVIDDHEKQVKSNFTGAWSFGQLESKLIDENVKEFPFVDPDDIFAILSTVIFRLKLLLKYHY